MSKYEISLWEDIYNEEQGYFDEQKLCIIGANDWEHPGRAIDPKLVRNINGTNTLTFKVYHTYIDPMTGEKVWNIFSDYLINERKVKLFWEDKWYDMLIKDCKENTKDKSIECTCKDAFIEELGKNGYEIELANELKNNSGTVTELGQKVVEGTDWVVDAENSSTLQEKIIDSVWEVNPYNNFDAHHTLDTNTTREFTPDDTVLVFYSNYTDKKTTLQFLTTAGENFATEQGKMEVINGVEYSVDGVEWSFDDASKEYVCKRKATGEALFRFGNFLSPKYRARYLKQTIKQIHDPLTNKEVQIYKDGSDNEIYKYIETPAGEIYSVTNIVPNGELDTYEGWNIEDHSIKTVTHKNSSTDNSTAADIWLNYIQLANKPEKDQVLENKNLCFSVDQLEGGFKVGTRYVVDIYASGDISERIAAWNNSSNSEKYLDVRLKTTNNREFFIPDGSRWERTLKTNFKEVNPDGNGYQYVHRNRNYIEIGEYVSEEDLAQQLEFSLTLKKGKYTVPDEYGNNMSIGNEASQIYGIYVYKELRVKDKEGKEVLVEPGAMNVDNSVVTYYCYYNPNSTNNKNLTDKGKIDFLWRKTTDTDLYKPVYIPNFQKVRIVSHSKSNRFNILQSLAEKFECWVRFEVEHDQTGKIVRDASGAQKKKVVFKDTFGENTGLVFSYDLDLKGLTRTLQSDKFTTKLIVPNNSNEVAQNGFCSITRARENYARDNFLYNFEYYYSQNMLNQEKTEEDLYGELSGINEKNGSCWRINPHKLNISDYKGLDPSDKRLKSLFSYVTKNLAFDIYELNGGPYSTTRMDYEQIYLWKDNGGTYPEPTGNWDLWTDWNKCPHEVVYWYDLKIGKKEEGKCWGIIARIHPTYKKPQIIPLIMASKEKYTMPGKKITSYKINDGEKTFQYVTNIYHSGFLSAIKLINLELLDIEEQFHLIEKQYNVCYADYGIASTQLKASKTNLSETCSTVQTYYGYNLKDPADYSKARIEANAARAAYNYDLEQYIDTYDRLNTEINNILQPKFKYYSDELASLDQKRKTNLEQQDLYLNEKNKILAALFKKYHNYIKEGTWKSDDHYNDTQYYTDAISVLYTSAQPQVSYDISVARLNSLDEYKYRKMSLGDICYVEDKDFFANQKEKVVITEIQYSLDNPSSDNAKVQNFRTQFADLFQRITATTQNMQYAQVDYSRAANAIKSDQTFDMEFLQNTLNNGDLSVTSQNGGMRTLPDGFLFVSREDPRQRTKLSANGLFVSNDGGSSWVNAINAKGINTKLLTAGQIDTTLLRIVNGKDALFNWDKYGLIAYDNYAYEKGIVFNKKGLFGTNNLVGLNLTDSDQIKNNCTFYLGHDKFLFRGEKGTNGQYIEFDSTGFVAYQDSSKDNYIQLTSAATEIKLHKSLKGGQGAVYTTINPQGIFSSVYDAVEKKDISFSLDEDGFSLTSRYEIDSDKIYNRNVTLSPMGLTFSSGNILAKFGTGGDTSAEPQVLLENTYGDGAFVNINLTSGDLISAGTASSTNFRVTRDGTVYANRFRMISPGTDCGIVLANQSWTSSGVIVARGRPFLYAQGENYYKLPICLSNPSPSWNGNNASHPSNHCGVYFVPDSIAQGCLEFRIEYVSGKKYYNGYLSAPNNLTLTAGTSGGFLVGSWYHNNSSNPVTSDRNKKREISPISDQYEIFFNNLEPITFKYNDGTSGRAHTGFIAQQVGEALEKAQISSQDFAGLVIKDPGTKDESWFLRYEEFVSVNTWQIQKAKARITELEQKVQQLEEKLKSL